jgi:hypothetical protein
VLKVRRTVVAKRSITIDDDVFGFLKREAIPFVDHTENDVLRRLLLNDTRKAPPQGATGALMPLISAGKLKAGDRLVKRQPRKRRTFTAEVTPDGYILINDGRKFAEPSPALKAYLGTEINGWAEWKVERTGGTLGDLR